MYPQIFQVLPYVYREMQTYRVIFFFLIYGVVLLFCGVLKVRRKTLPLRREDTKTKMIIVVLFSLEDGFLSFKPFSCA